MNKLDLNGRKLWSGKGFTDSSAMTATHSIHVAQGHSLPSSYKQSFGKVLAIFETRRNQIWSRQRFFTEVCWLPGHWVLSNRLDSRSLHITYLSVYNQAWAKKRKNSPNMDLKVFCYDTMVFHGCLLWPWPLTYLCKGTL